MKQTRYLNIGIFTIFAAAALWLLAVRNGYMLRWYDELSLFESTWLFFRQFLYYPGGLLRWAGTWLTQLLYYPWLGSSVLIALWLLLAWITVKAFRLSKAATPLSLLVPIAMLVSVVQLDEAWLTLKSPGYIYSNTLGYIFTMIAVMIHSRFQPKPIMSAIIEAVTALCYPVAGFYALLGAALCAVSAMVTAIRERKHILLLTAAVTILLTAVIPPLYYTYLHGNTVDNDHLYLKGLPELMMEGFDLYLWMPFIMATGLLLLTDILSSLGWFDDSRFLQWISIAAVCCGAVWGIKASEKSEQLRATVLMLQRIDRYDWAGITGIMGRIKEPPNYTMRVLNSLALTNQGHPGGNVAAYQPASGGDGRHSEKFTMTALVQVPLYFNIGRFNQSSRWAMEHTVQYGKRVYFLKYMVKGALLRGEIPLAKRYNDILMATMFHRQWAEEMQRYIDNPKLISENQEFQRALQYGEGEKKREAEDSTAEVH